MPNGNDRGCGHPCREARGAVKREGCLARGHGTDRTCLQGASLNEMVVKMAKLLLLLPVLILCIFLPTTAYAATSAGVTVTVQGYVAGLVVSTLSPPDDAAGVALDANLVITFDQPVDAQSGNIIIAKTSNGTTFETIDVASARVTGSGTNTITINPAGTFAYATEYYVLIDAICFDNLAGVSYAGISDSTTWNFTTASVPSAGATYGFPPHDIDTGDLSEDTYGDGVQDGGEPDLAGTSTEPTPTPTPTPPIPTPTPVPEVGVGDLTDRISSEGVMLETINVSCADGNATAEIPAGTKALDAEGNPLAEISCEPPDRPAPVPPDRNMIAVYGFGPDGATFDPPITVTMSYDPVAIPAGVAEEDLVLAYYDAATGTWVEFTGIVVDTVNHTISGKTSHFTQFAVLAKAVVDVTPSVISAVSAPEISTSEATIEWSTDEPATSQVEYGTTLEYGLTTPIDETLVTKHEVELRDLDSATTYRFRVKSRDDAGNLAISKDYRVTTEGKGLSTWAIVVPTIVAIFAVALVAYNLVMRRRQQSQAI